MKRMRCGDSSVIESSNEPRFPNRNPSHSERQHVGESSAATSAEHMHVADTERHWRFAAALRDAKETTKNNTDNDHDHEVQKDMDVN